MVDRIGSLQDVRLDWELTLIWVHCLPFEVVWGLIVRDTMKSFQSQHRKHIIILLCGRLKPGMGVFKPR